MDYPLTAILSDLHGNVPALQVALHDARARGVERYVCLGDVVGYGAGPRACLDRIMDLCVPGAVDSYDGGRPLADGLCLMGNHEQALLYHAEDFNPKARAAIEWTREELGRDEERVDEYWDFLGALPTTLADDVAMFVHGSPRDPVREYMLPRDARNPAKLERNFACMERGVCFIGHSHVPGIYRPDGELYRPSDEGESCDLGDLAQRPCIVNVGSVGQPRDGNPRLSYAVFDGRTLTFVRLEYDVEVAAAAIRAVAELPDFLAERLSTGK